MRIIYLHQYFNTPDMSGGTRSYEMGRRLVRAGHEVHMVTTQRNPDGTREKQWLETDEAGIHVHWLPLAYSNKMGYRQRMRAFLKFAWHSAKKAAGLKGDVVFATSTPLTIALPAVYAARKNKIPMVFEVRDLWPELPIAVGALKNPLAIGAARWLERFAYRNAAWVVALSPGMKEGIAKRGYPEDKVVVIPNSCDLGLFRVPQAAGEEFLAEHPYLKGGPLITYAGALGLINGVGYLAEIAGAMLQIEPQVHFLVVGEGKEEESIRSYAQELGVLGKNFWMLPPVPKSDMPKVLSASTLACSLVIDVPELWHNSANKFFDALAAARPVMINHQGWQADLLCDREAGLVVPPRAPHAAACALCELLSDEQRLATAGHAAETLAEQMFDRDKLARQLQGTLERAVEEAN